MRSAGRLTGLFPSRNLEWPFWTKLVVVAIGFTGGLLFMSSSLLQVSAVVEETQGL